MKKQYRELIYNKYNGKCAYCGCGISLSRFHIDHIEPVLRSQKIGNKNVYDLSNMNPSCLECNLMKSSYSLEEFRDKISGFTDKLRLRNAQYRFALKYGLIKEYSQDVVFYFERIKQ